MSAEQAYPDGRELKSGQMHSLSYDTTSTYSYDMQNTDSPCHSAFYHDSQLTSSGPELDARSIFRFLGMTPASGLHADVTLALARPTCVCVTTDTLTVSPCRYRLGCTTPSFSLTMYPIADKTKI